MDSAEEAKPETMQLLLDPPVTWNKGTYATLDLREPRAGEVRKAEGQMRSGVNAETLRAYNITLVSMVSGLPVPVIEQVRISELNRASAFLMGFLEVGQQTGPI